MLGEQKGSVIRDEMLRFRPERTFGRGRRGRWSDGIVHCEDVC